MLSVLVLSFILLVTSSNLPEELSVSSAYITPDGRLYSPELAVTTTLYARTMTIDSGSHQRIIDVAGKVDLASGKLTASVTLSSVIEAEATDDGISAYDYNLNQITYVSNGAFGGAVFTADLTNNVVLPPTSYYLLPVAYLGYDGVTGSKVIAGQAQPGKNYVYLDKPNNGLISTYSVPATVALTANDAYDGKTGNYYVANGASLTTWNIFKGTSTSFALGCIPTNSYLSGNLLVNPLDSNIVLGILENGEDYSLMTINLSGKNCNSTALSGLPPSPRIIIASTVGHITGYVAVSVAADAYEAVIFYDQTGKLINQVKTSDTLEDIFVQEASTQ